MTIIKMILTTEDQKVYINDVHSSMFKMQHNTVIQCQKYYRSKF